MEKINLLEKKKNLLGKALRQMESQGEALEEKLAVLDMNHDIFSELQNLENQIQGKNTLYPQKQQRLEEDILVLLQRLQEKTEILYTTLKHEHGEMKKAIGQLNKSRSMAGSYLQASQGPVFVDRDFV